MTTSKRSITILLIFSPIFVLAQTVTPQWVIDWLNQEWMTIYDTVDEYRPDDLITRSEASKMMTQFAQSLELQQNYSGSCDFEDVIGYDETLVPFIILSCEYGLLKGWNGLFTPDWTLTQAQALVIIQRARSGFEDESWTPRYSIYFNNAVQLWIVESSQLESVATTPITRFELWARLYLASLTIEEETRTVYIPQWEVDLPPVVVQNQQQSSPTPEQPRTVLSPTRSSSRASRDETKLNGSYTWSFNYDTYQPYSDAALQLELTAWKRVALFFWDQSSLQSRTLDNNIKQWVRWNISILFVDYNVASSLKTTYGVSAPHTLVYLNNSWNTLFKTVGIDVSVNGIINNFDNDWPTGDRNRI